MLYDHGGFLFRYTCSLEESVGGSSVCGSHFQTPRDPYVWITLAVIEMYAKLFIYSQCGITLRVLEVRRLHGYRV